MIKLLLKIFAALLLLALVVIAFIKILPWAIAIIVVLALVKFSHDWLRRNGITPSALVAWWKKDDGHQPTAAPQ